jgi:hypothetical protein
MKRVLAAVAFSVGLSVGAQAQIPLLSGPSDPSQLQATVNRLITAINASTFSQAFPAPAAGTTAPNSIVLTAAAAGSVPLISPASVAAGGDANAALGISPNGSGNLIFFGNYGGTAETGVVQFANASSFMPRVGLAGCPGYQRQGAPVGMSDNIAGYLVFQDWLGRPHYVPSC